MNPKDRITALEAECAKLRAENKSLRAMIQARAPGKATAAIPEAPRLGPPDTSVHHNSPTAEKVALFRSLFRGREDIYPLRWESKTGRTGYSPACANEWISGICEKPRIKCTDCPNQAFVAVSDESIYDHLAGRRTLGAYSILKDDTTWFVAADFDGSNWRDDAMAYATSCRELSLPASIEISRSGKGAHVWIFFASPIPAREARQLASAAITRACARHRTLAFESYDRLFPSQDTLPKGGFGNSSRFHSSARHVMRGQAFLSTMHGSPTRTSGRFSQTFSGSHRTRCARSSPELKEKTASSACAQ